MQDVFELTIPLPGKPQVLKLRFNNSAYKLIEKMTGVSVFAAAQDSSKVQSSDFLVAALFAATRKYHSQPPLSLEQINEWLDEIETSDLFKVYGDILKAWAASFLAPPERKIYLQKIENSEKAAKEAKVQTGLADGMSISSEQSNPE